MNARLVGFALLSALAAGSLAVAGCSSGSPSAAGALPNAAHPLSGSGGPYVVACEGASFGGSPFCDVFSSSGESLYSLPDTTEPGGSKVFQEQLWLANTTESESNAQVYTVNASEATLEKSYQDTYGYAEDVAIFAKGKGSKETTTVAISNSSDFKGEELPSVTVLDVSTGTSKNLKDPNATNGEQIAFDSKGNCVWMTDSGSTIDFFKKCAGKPTYITPDMGGPGAGVALDQNNNLWYSSTENGWVTECQGETYSCTRIFDLVDPLFINFDSTYSNLYVAVGPSGNPGSSIQKCSISAQSCTTFATPINSNYYFYSVSSF